MNNSDEPQEFTVTVYQYPVGVNKIEKEKITHTIAPGIVFHNANLADYEYDAVYTIGYYTEVVVEVNSPNMHPIVEQWSGMGGEIIPGTLITSGDFVGIKQPNP